MGSLPAHHLVLELSSMNPEAVLAAAVRDTLSSSPGVSKEITPTVLHQQFEYLWCYASVWTAFAKGEPRAILPVMLAAGCVPLVGLALQCQPPDTPLTQDADTRN